jgi:hypothetical protein
MRTDMIETCDCSVIAPDYRKSFEAAYPAAIDDCYDALVWIKKNAQTSKALGWIESRPQLGLIIGFYVCALDAVRGRVTRNGRM